jgi:cystathionine gamma-lyase
MGFNTKQVHAGVRPDPVTGSILTPVYQSTTFVQDSVDEYLSKGFSYSRSGNPTVRALEEKIAILENGADCTCYATGMAAVQAVIQATLSAGDHAVVSDVAYGGTYRLATTVYARYGVEFTFANSADPAEVEEAVRDNTKLILTETPANPTLKLTDIRAISDIARTRGIPHAVDNTFLTPYYQRPLELGANISIHSTTKYFDGHNATVGGAAVADTRELNDKIKYVQNAGGIIMSPWVAWLTLQGTKTLSIRMERQSANAQAVAEFLEAHPKVERVRYPGLESFPQHELARRRRVSGPCSGSRSKAASRPARRSWTRSSFARWRRISGPSRRSLRIRSR